MKTRLFNGTRNIALCGAFVVSLGLGSSIQSFAQPGHARGQNNKENREEQGGRNSNSNRTEVSHGNRGEKPGNGHAYGYYRNQESRNGIGNGNAGHYNNREYNREYNRGQGNGYAYERYNNHGNAYGHYNNRGYNREPQWQYRGIPGRGAFVSYAPSASIALNFRGLSLYFNNGIYYRPYGHGYRVIGAPIGLRINALPRGYVQLYVGNMPYYYYCGTYYRNYSGCYEVVRPPVGALVESIPNGYQEMNIDGETYYEVDGVQYKPELCNGEVWYRVLKVS